MVLVLHVMSETFYLAFRLPSLDISLYEGFEQILPKLGRVTHTANKLNVSLT